eukprot:TRINITY_DN14686_c0_g1_i1.p1 TRINITY_DN14686_c0_g1~~TRINITY_DN14686_c0_g1_i1.p1  ORF type:complete len:421 (+),score=42.00 TRINITY_DN14686_c0_g1_i1:316-1578(+)
MATIISRSTSVSQHIYSRNEARRDSSTRVFPVSFAGSHESLPRLATSSAYPSSSSFRPVRSMQVIQSPKTSPDRHVRRSPICLAKQVGGRLVAATSSLPQTDHPWLLLSSPRAKGVHNSHRGCISWGTSYSSGSKRGRRKSRVCGSSGQQLLSWSSEGSMLGHQGSRLPRAESGARVSARLFGPAIFEAQKLRVLFLGGVEDEQCHPAKETSPRAYTLTHSDITAKLTLAVAREFNKSQFSGWYSRLQRDEVLAVWKKCWKSPSQVALHVHCHISGGHFLLNAIARLRFWIFRKELPVVINAFRHGDRALLDKHPDLELSPVWVHFHSNIREFSCRECWGPLVTAAETGIQMAKAAVKVRQQELEDAIVEGDDVWPTMDASLLLEGLPLPAVVPAHVVPDVAFIPHPPVLEKSFNSLPEE